MKAKLAMIAFAFALAVLIPGALAEENTTSSEDDTGVSIWNIGHWFMETTGYFMKSVSEKGGEWFGIDPSIMILFLLILFLYAIRAKGNGWLFWALILMVMFFVATGMIPLEEYV